jgi:hypothetical protein
MRRRLVDLAIGGALSAMAAARRTQTALDAAVGDAEHAERLLDPLQVRELTPAEAAAEWPDTVPMDSALLSWMEGATR